LELYIFFKARLAAAEKKYNVMKFTKRKYYRGECTQQELQQYGWPQWQGLKPSGTELNQLFDMDSDLNDLQEKVEYFKTSVSTLEYIMKAIQSRDWQLKTLFEVQRYMNG
jgi:hypothetical protein